MTTDNFVETARAEAEALRDDIIRWDDTIATDGPCDGTWDSLAAHLAVLGWARPRPTAQEPTDEAWVDAASRSWAENGPTPASWYGMSRHAQDRTRERMRKALEDAGCLSAARAARRDEEDR